MAEIGYIQVTRNCNQECIICSNPPTNYRLDFDQAKKEIDSLVAKKCEGVILTGGEPTIYPRLPDLIKYCFKKGIFPRIITNGQKIADMKYLKSLKAAGLRHLHVSIHSCHAVVQARITKNKSSLRNIMRALANIRELGGITTNVNVTITKYNAGHLEAIVDWLIQKHGFISHFVFNNLDPCLNRVCRNPDIIPRLNDFELELHKALSLLRKSQKTFRVERVPLCYLTDFEHVSTETRKIAKKESRTIYFLDERGKISQDYWYHQKGKCCQACSVNSLCAGLYAKGEGFEEKELYPVFIEPAKILQRIEDER